MKLYDIRLEMTALRTICDSSNKTGQAKLVARLNASFFYDEVASETYKRITKTLSRQSRIPEWDELMVDPILSEAARAELENYSAVTPLSSQSRMRSLYEKLDFYRKARILFFQSEKNLKALENDKIDVDELLRANVEQIVNAQVSTRSEKEILTIGHNDNSEEMFEALLSNERADVIRTGFEAFDARNGGFMPGSLVVIAATSGGGKSAMGNQLGINFARGGRKTCLVPLEMTEKETMARAVANVAGIDVKKFLFTKLTEREKKQARRAFRAFRDECEKLHGAFRIWEPEEDLSIEEILTILRPYNDDVIMIDYIGLLKGVDGDDSWRQLANAARFAKVWARNNNKIVILMAQLSDEGAIRYSKGVKEHANNMWCVPAGTLVATPNGLRAIESMVTNPHEITHDLRLPVISDGAARYATSFVYSGVRPVHELVTDRGAVIRATPNERFKVLRPDFTLEWTTLDSLQPGDLIARSYLPRHTDLVEAPAYSNIEPYRSEVAAAKSGASRLYTVAPIRVPRYVNEQYARLIGYLLTDGCVTDDYVAFTSGDDELIADFIECFESQFGEEARFTKTSGSNTDYTIIRTQNRNVVAYFNSIEGLRGGSREKYIPDIIMSSRRAILGACLGAMIDCDGSVSKRGDRTLYFTTSPRMSERFHLALQNLGINAKTSGERRPPYTGTGYGLLTTEIAGFDNLVLLRRYASSLLERKSVRLHKTSYHKMQSLPFLSSALLARGLDRSSALYRKLCTASTVDTSLEAKWELVIEHMDELKDAAPDLHEAVLYMLASRYFFERVKSVDYVGDEPTFDLSVPETHTFVANGFVIHNTWVYTEENRETKIIDVVPQKARNQEMFDFQLGHDFSTMRIFDIDGEQDESALERRRSKNGRERQRRLKDATVEIDNTRDVDRYLEDRSA